MMYLLNVNALLAFGLEEHVFHERTTAWITSISRTSKPLLATCPITELGFVRILSSVPHYSITVAQARGLLASVKSSPQVEFSFVQDDEQADALPAWVKLPRQVTDGHLVQLASSASGKLATLDKNIPVHC